MFDCCWHDYEKGSYLAGEGTAISKVSDGANQIGLWEGLGMEVPQCVDEQ